MTAANEAGSKLIQSASFINNQILHNECSCFEHISRKNCKVDYDITTYHYCADVRHSKSSYSSLWVSMVIRSLLICQNTCSTHTAVEHWRTRAYTVQLLLRSVNFIFTETNPFQEINIQIDKVYNWRVYRITKLNAAFHI